MENIYYQQARKDMEDAGTPSFNHHAINAYGETLLFAAIATNHIVSVKATLTNMSMERRTQTNISGNNIIHFAATQKDTPAEIMEYLCQNVPYAALTQKNDRGQTPLDLANRELNGDQAGILFRHILQGRQKTYPAPKLENLPNKT